MSKTINLMVGSNYDPALPLILKKLNEVNPEKVQVTEIYGSIKQLKLFGSARPDFRLPDLSRVEFEDQVIKYNVNGILVNYTENTPIVNKAQIDKGLLKEKLDYLKMIGIGRLTLAHPLAMELVSELSDIPIEVSTIYAVSKPFQIRELIRRCPTINKVCMDVDFNRDFNTIQALQKEGITIELLANEFCLHDCIDRVQCYNDHAQVSTEAEAASFSRYPMGRCISKRMDPVEWLRARFILPQWMNWYRKFVGINHFKVTGRTHPTSYIKWIVEQYVKEDFQGNLLELWADVKNIKRVSQGKEHLAPTFEIDTKKITTDLLWKYRDDPKMAELDFEYEYLKTLL